ncbi:hypothetical protein cce_1324 [Crocosphaera subtropica ATCC 51142]|uniref:Uncharacterized protein n=1 Tax=Crocosphaera subtropica (strain ATCC 51142 / BH68) TaxID=43989 RepID=B1WVT7_CROS5|nr:helix-turn-helix domain-containing protein [Crocosphaera subtropica]ACB50674.1 hypothetical protein cce_1324 [Crocosphaera subtropica ATCC 51142]
MPKQAFIAPHLSTEELKEKYRKAKDSVEARRWHFLWKVANGWTVKNSAIAVGISNSYGWKILKSYSTTSLRMVICLWICGTQNRKNLMVLNTESQQ